MVFGAISKEGKSELYFKEQDEAINSETYMRTVEDIVLPMAKKCYGYDSRRREKWYFQ